MQLKTRRGTLFVSVFITENERAIAVVLRRDGESGVAVGSETFRPESRSRLKTECFRWLARHELDDQSRIRLGVELSDTFQAFEALRTGGPDISHGWPGSRASRRVPEVVDSST